MTSPRDLSAVRLCGTAECLRSQRQRCAFRPPVTQRCGLERFVSRQVDSEFKLCAHQSLLSNVQEETVVSIGQLLITIFHSIPSSNVFSAVPSHAILWSPERQQATMHEKLLQQRNDSPGYTAAPPMLNVGFPPSRISQTCKPPVYTKGIFHKAHQLTHSATSNIDHYKIGPS